MAYYTITYATTDAAYRYIQDNWVDSNQINFFKKEVLTRAAFLALAPASLVTISLDVILGLGAGIATICTLGKYKPTRSFAIRHLSDSNDLLAVPYKFFLKAINPDARMGIKGGFVVPSLVQPLLNYAENCAGSANFLKKHVVSRLTYALAAIACVVTRAVDGIFCLSFVALSVITAGKLEAVNNLAYKTLKVPGIINDLFSITLKIIEP